MRNTDESSLHCFSALKSKKHLSYINKSSPFYLSTIHARRFLFRVLLLGAFYTLIMRHFAV